jgi:hypothetical protein
MFDRFDPRDRDDDPRHGGDIYDARWDNDPRDRAEDCRERDRDRDPRDPFVEGLDLPRGLEREIVLDERDRTYELNGEDCRTMATVGAFRVVSESDLRDPREGAFDLRDDHHRHLRDQGLMRSVSLDGRERVVTLTDRGRSLLECHRRDRDEERRQEFHAGVSRPRELTHDASLYGAYLRAEERLREEGGDIRRVVLENDLKREYQEWLQEHNRGRPDSDGRPDRDPREIEEWAREHDLPYFDESVHFPDFRLEYELDGRDRHEDIEVITDNYRGGHAASRARAGFTCYASGGGRGGRPFDPRVAEDFI